MKSSAVLLVLLFVMAGCRSQSSFVLDMDNAGHLRWNGESVANYAELRSEIRQTFRKYDYLDHPIVFRLGSALTAGDILRLNIIFREEAFVLFQYETEAWKTEPQLDLVLEPMSWVTFDDDMIWMPLFENEQVILLRDGMLTAHDSIRPPLQDDDAKNQMVLLCGAGESVDLMVWGMHLAQSAGFPRIHVLIIGEDEAWPEVLREPPRN